MFLILSLGLLLGERRDHALALFLDVFGEAGVALFDEPGCKPELEERHGESRSEIVEVGTDFGQLERFDGFVEKLLHRLVQLRVGEEPGFGSILSHNKILAQKKLLTAEDAEDAEEIKNSNVECSRERT